jgi:hypothetical protein
MAGARTITFPILLFATGLKGALKCGTIKNLPDREVVAQAQYSMAFRCFLGLSLHSPLPHHTLLTVFTCTNTRKCWAADPG